VTSIAEPVTARPQDRVVTRKVKRRDWPKIWLGVYFVVFLLFLYLPMILMAVLSFQGPNGNLTFPFQGPISTEWWQRIFDSSIFGSPAEDIRNSGAQSLWLSLAAGVITAVLGFTLSQAFRRRFRGSGLGFFVIMLALMTPAFLVGLGNQLLWTAMQAQFSLWKTALGANVVWGIPFSFLIMLAVWNRYDRRVEEAARDLGAGRVRTFREVTLPLIWTGIFGSFLFGFTLTWNDFDRTVLLQNGYDVQPLPILIGTWPSSRSIQPDLYALGAATTGVTLVAIAVLLVLASITLRLRTAPVRRVQEELGETSGLRVSDK
jgi:putative spermidine/putrescine transport system permease protein